MIQTSATVYDIFEESPESKSCNTESQSLSVFKISFYFAEKTSNKVYKRPSFQHQQDSVLFSEDIFITENKSITNLGKLMRAKASYASDSTLTWTITAPNSTLSDEEPFWRGIFVPSHQPEVIFSKKIEVKVDELATWKPNIVIDADRLEDDE
jgi:hypothetical protein